eukprot:CAMPEP_0194736162 /NCGR_PEP_ID=MMETSP0296-20130528/76398_1 /TAXON_ID=39354 /ORGANISM="Heterosigma akashiwo, Strain CCMP2393" /LENGTH=54 /DNA_ID=CAMNT_0039645641 /DNA_START=192 /DNA_END=356 /DNA_ORIENTATION=+
MRSSSKQYLDHCLTPCICCFMQGCGLLLVSGITVSSSTQQQLHDLQVALLGCMV